ncbi:MAG TPA: proteasome-activating nucleotidase [Candidatus Methanomethylicus sp.]|nr:proteasome-activating nucleotidase [Candidatus Methanomethylicus sp.]HRR54857.1 proteasome-activating nucleotidase [Candidatus Methanomethylicus sp.]
MTENIDYKDDGSTLLLQLKKLEQRAFELEAERRDWFFERDRLQREIQALRTEVEKLTVPPYIEGNITDVLEDGRAVVKSSTGPSLIVNVLKDVDVKKLTPSKRVALSQRNFAVLEVLPDSLDMYVKAMEVVETPKVSYTDIGGLKDQIRDIKELVELPLLKPEVFEKVGIEPPKGVLLQGPPGCGKTLLAKAVANGTKATFIKVVASELVQKYIGEGARMVRELFQLARAKAPSIVFIDEIDAVGGRRGDISVSGEREVQRTLLQLLSELDGFDSRGDVKIIGATNRIDLLDPALLRPGRFDRVIEIPAPDAKGRESIFKIHISRMNVSKEVSMKELADITDGATGAEIKAICTEAGLFAIRNDRDMITKSDFSKAIDKLLKREGGKSAASTYL